MNLVTLNEENFNETTADNEIVIIDFWAPWCGPCMQFAPLFEKIAQNNPDITFGKVNTEEERGIGGHFQIRSIPTIMIFRDNVVIFLQAGVMSEAGFIDIIEQVKALDMDVVRKEIESQSAQSAN